MVQGLRPKLTAKGMKFSNQLGQWSYFGAPIGDFGTEYAYRALVAIAGLGANTVEDAPADTTNWLPVGNEGFHLYMRIYTPDMDALETWTAPVITEIANIQSPHQ